MEITYVVIVAIVTYALGAVTKAFIHKIPNKFIPLQNLIIGIISAGVCIYAQIEADVLQAFVLCIMASAGAGGVSDLLNKNNYYNYGKGKRK